MGSAAGEHVAFTRDVDATHLCGNADQAIGALSTLSGDEVVLLLSSGPLLGLPDALPPVFDNLYGPPAAAVA